MPKRIKSFECPTAGCIGTAEGEPVEVEAVTAYQRCSCTVCDAEWELGFTLTDRVVKEEDDG